MKENNNRFNHYDKIFSGISANSMPSPDIFADDDTRGEIKISLLPKKIFGDAENFFIGAFGLFLANFSAADESFFTIAEGDKKIPVQLWIDDDEPTEIYLENAEQQVKSTRENFLPYEEVRAKYNFADAPNFSFDSAPATDTNLNFAVCREGENFFVAANYRKGSYSEKFVNSMLDAYVRLAENFCAGKKLGEVDMLSEKAEEILKNLHDTTWEVAERPAYRLLQDSAEKFPDKVAVIANKKSLNYRELNAAANKAGRCLQNAGIGAEKIVGVILDRGLEVYIARQGILKSGGAFLPIAPDYPDDRVEYVLKDAGSNCIITSREIYNQRKNFFDSLNLQIIFVEDTQAENISAENLNVAVPYDALAYCIYTSGSTGKPKGVMLTQKNLVNFVDANPKNFEILGYTERGKVELAMAAMTFDVSIMEEFVPLANGLTVCMANEEEIHNPLLMRDLFLENHVDLMNSTPSYLANLIDMEEMHPAIKQLRAIDFGAEAFPASLYEKIRAINPDVHIMNGYGPTEATISCIMKVIDSGEHITIGIPNSNVKVVILDKKNRVLPLGAVGELTILGDGVGRGYKNLEEKTKNVFIKVWDTPAYKSGDLARILPNGEVEFRGRTDNQVKLRGLRVELGEIETVMNKFAGIKSCIVVVKKSATEDYLAGYFTADKKIDTDELKKHLSGSLTSYMVPAVLIQLEKMPLTANGKIDKKKLPEPENLETDTAEIIPPQNETQQKIFDCIAEVVGHKNFGVTTNIYSAGLNSIGAMRLNLTLHNAFDKPIKTADLVENDTIEKLEKFLNSLQKSSVHAVQKYYPLTQTQKGIYIECDANPGAVIYNLPALLPVPESVDVEKLQRAISAAIDAHPYVKAKIFVNDEGEILAERNDDAPAVVTIRDVEELPENILRPFDLSGERLYRAEIYRTANGNYLFTDFHHIVYDGTSEEIFFDDVNAAYGGKILSKENYTGFELALDEENSRNSDELDRAKKYYRELLEGTDTESIPPADENISAAPGIAFEKFSDSVPLADVQKFCADTGITFNSFFNSAFAVALSKKIGKQETVFTTIYNGRGDSRLANSVGMFVKTLPVVCVTEPAQSVKNFVSDTGRQIVESMSRDIFSFAEISAEYGVTSEVMCAYQGEDFDVYDLAGEKVSALPMSNNAAMSALCVEVFLEDDAFKFRAEYRPELYAKSGIEKFLRDMYDAATGFFTAKNISELLGDVQLKPPVKIRKKIRAEKFLPPENDTQQKIFDCISAVVGHKNFGVDTDIYTTGLNSIGAMKLNVLLSKKFNVTFRTKDLRTHETILKLEELISASGENVTYEMRTEYPLTQTQDGIFIDSVANPNTTIYNIPTLYKLGKNVDVEKLRGAISAAIDAHPYLKITLAMNDAGDIVAKRHDDFEPIVSVNRTENLNVKNLVRPFELLNSPLYRIEIYDGDEKYLFADFHHIVMDGYSFDIFFGDVNSAYGGKILSKEKFTGFELALEEERLRATDALKNAIAHYDKIFAGCDADCLPKKDFNTGVTGKVAFEKIVPDYPADAVKKFCAENNFTPGAFFQSVFGFTLAEYLYRDEVIFTTIYNGRNDSRLSDTVSMSVKTLPVYCDLSGDRSIKDFVDATGRQLVESMENDIFSFGEISHRYEIKPDVMFAYQGEHDPEIKIGGEPAEEIPLDLNAAKAEFGLDVYIEKNNFVLEFEYLPQSYSKDTIHGFAETFSQVAKEFLIREKLSEVEIVSPEENLKLQNLHDTDWEVAERPAYRLLQDSAEKFPDKVAVIANKKSLTYRELNAAANKAGRCLQNAGIGAEKIVGVILERGLEVYIARQGISKSGGAFLPIAPDYPDDRIEYVLKDAGSNCIITSREIYHQRKNFFDSLNLQIIFVEDTQSENISAENLNVAVPYDALAYCIYTSGSTGKPKGVMLTQKNLVNFVDANPKNFEILGYTERGKVELAMAAMTFDVSIMEEFVPLANGLTVCMANEEEIHNPLLMRDLFLENHVDLMNSTPSYLANLIDMEEMHPAIKQLRAIDFGAEAFPSSLYEKIRAINPDVHIMNGYGPTEATISCIMKVIDSGEHITIGIPNSNVKVVILDKKNRVLPVGAVGELTILGDGVGRGYKNLEEKNKNVFIRVWDTPAYKSGDLARILPNGEVEFHGRTDNQVKLRGFRVELGEIETVMNKFAGIKSCIVVVKNNSTEDYLAGYFTADKKIDIDELKKHLSGSLTAYMVPAVLIQLEKMPLTANGKIDKKKLPEPEISTVAVNKKAPTSQLQKILCDMMSKAVGHEIGANENFFESGGTSLSASKVAMQAYLKNLPIVYADVFNFPTAEKLEQRIIELRNQSGEEISDAPENKNTFEDPDVARAVAKNSPAYVDEIKAESIGNVLLTGCTGFLGVHVLYELLRNGTSKIYCLTRKGKAESVAERIKGRLVYYFSENFDDVVGSRIIPIEGDITDKAQVDDTEKLDFQTVINCAASVKHFAADDILNRINVEGVKNLVDMCSRKKVRLIQISTVSVAGDNVDNSLPVGKTIHENELYFGQDVKSNKYVYTKFLAEECVLQKVGRGELDAKIIRVGNLMSRQSDGEFQINFVTNAFMRDLRGYVTLGKFPVAEMDMPVEFSPIDEVAKTVVILSGTNSDFTVFHSCNSHVVQMGDVIHAINDYGIKIDVVSDEIFDNALRDAMANEKKSKSVSGLIAYRETDESRREEVGYDMSFTVKALYRLGYKWPITGEEYIKKAIEALDTLGFFYED